MPVQTNALLFGRTAENLTTGSVPNLMRSAQLGLGPHIPDLDGATPLVLPHIVPVIVGLPTIFRHVPEMYDLMKSIMEKHAKNIDGVDLEYTMEYGTTPVGHDGQMMSMPTQHRRTQPKPSFTFQEVTSNAIWRSFLLWQRLMKDPDTQAAFTASVIRNRTSTIYPQLLSSISADVLMLQYSTDRRVGNLIDAYFIVGMMPDGTSPFGIRKEAGGAEGFPERNITFTGIIQHNSNTRWLGQRVADILGMHRVDFDIATPATPGIAPELNDMGIQQEITRSVTEFRALGPEFSAGSPGRFG
jgi:hypothetical protein